MSDIIGSGSLVFYMIMFLPAEFYLMYLNYLARVKYKEHFKETTKLWLIFDKRGLTVLSLILHFAIVTIGMVFLASYSELQFFAGLGCGLVWFNAIVDDRTLKSKLPCIETKCANLDIRKKCLNCAVPNEYNISLFPRIRIKKKKDNR
ncbi:MAG: hypothetical protein WAN82_01025 [Candidatus Bathyarchaeia archaeon]